jgi:hypothetical protein
MYFHAYITLDERLANILTLISALSEIRFRNENVG